MTAATPDCWCDLVNVEPHAAGDHPTETPGTPATTWPTKAELERWWECFGDDFDPDEVAEFVAAREAAAREEGRAEVRYEADMNRAGYEHARAQIEVLRAEVAVAQQILAAALDGEEVSRGDLAYDVDTVVDQRDEARREIVRLAVQQNRATTRAAAVAVPDTTHEGGTR